MNIKTLPNNDFAQILQGISFDFVEIGDANDMNTLSKYGLTY
jgi:hypothetical protein